MKRLFCPRVIRSHYCPAAASASRWLGWSRGWRYSHCGREVWWDSRRSSRPRTLRRELWSSTFAIIKPGLWIRILLNEVRKNARTENTSRRNCFRFRLFVGIVLISLSLYLSVSHTQVMLIKRWKTILITLRIFQRISNHELFSYN